MATKIGQKNGYAIFNNSDTSIGDEIVNQFSVIDGDAIITIVYSELEKNFSNNLNYYIEGAISKNKRYSRKINIYLTDNNSTAKYTIATLNIDRDSLEDEEVHMEPFKIAFRPGKSQYNQLVFENVIDNVGSSDKDFIIDLTSVMQLKSIVSGEKVIQLGSQADPGFIFLLNGEPMKIGRRGFFESPEGYEVTDIAVTEPNFIMDYKYEEGV